MIDNQDVVAGADLPFVSDYFERIPKWSGGENKKRFEVMADTLSGRIPVTRLDSWRDFTGLLEHPFFNRAGVKSVFRGQRRFEWGLMPSLGRITSNGIITRALADAQIDRFKRAVRGRLGDTSLVDEDDELWSVGQHHGLMTPLLDWTYSPYVALFFAFEKPDSDEESPNPYRVIYALNKTFLADHEEETGIRVCEPRKDGYGRLVNQAGLFTFSPYDATIENKLTTVLGDGEGFDDDELRTASEDEQPDLLARYICKIYIRNEERDACLRHLGRMNVHHASLFPDLHGASEYCNVAAAVEELERAILVRSEPSDPAPKAVSVPVAVQEDPSVYHAPESGIVGSIQMALVRHQEASHVEPGRLQLIAEALAESIARHKVVDWETREAVQARLRNVARVVLRRHGYPAGLRDTVAEEVVELAKLESKQKEQA